MHFIVSAYSFPIRTLFYESAKPVHDLEQHDLEQHDSENFQHQTMNFFTVSICIGEKGREPTIFLLHNSPELTN